MSYLDNELTSNKILILVHGWLESKNHYLDFGNSFETDKRIIIPDLRGHGESSSPQSDYTIDEFSNDIFELICAVFDSSASFILVGHSLGGMIITDLATRLDSRIDGLIYLNSSLNFNDFNPLSKIADRLISFILRKNTYRLAVLTRLAFGLRPERRSIRIEQNSILTTSNYVAIESFRNAILGLNYYKTIEKMDIPVLSIGGVFDPLLPLLHAHKIARNAKFGYFRLVPKAGHFVMMEDLDRVKFYIKEFLSIPRIS